VQPSVLDLANPLALRLLMFGEMPLLDGPVPGKSLFGGRYQR
jgi:hypothetical protein